MIHVFCGKWPLPQIGQIRIEGKKYIPVTEAERREVFLKTIGDDHPLMALILRCIDNNPQARPPTKEISEKLAEIVRQHPLNRQAVLMPVLPVANKRKNEKAKRIMDYDFVEIKVGTNETSQKVVVKPAEVKQEESISWARKQIRRAKALFMQKYQVGLAFYSDLVQLVSCYCCCCCCCCSQNRLQRKLSLLADLKKMDKI